MTTASDRNGPATVELVLRPIGGIPGSGRWFCRVTLASGLTDWPWLVDGITVDYNYPHRIPECIKQDVYRYCVAARAANRLLLRDT